MGRTGGVFQSGADWGVLWPFYGSRPKRQLLCFAHGSGARDDSRLHSLSVPLPFHLSGAMAGTFVATMGMDSLTEQLNAMHSELVARFAANEDEHKQLRAASETMRKAIDKLETEVSDLRKSQATIQLTLSATTDQARSVLESIVVESRQALDGVRGEGLMALQTAITNHN